MMKNSKVVNPLKESFLAIDIDKNKLISFKNKEKQK